MLIYSNGLELSFARTVHRGLVHKSAVGEVVVTDSARVAEDVYLVAAQWPRKHWHFGEPAQSLSPLLVAETLRQACLLIVTAHLGVSVDAHLTIDEFAVHLSNQRLSHTSPPEIIVRMETVVTRTTHGQVRSIGVRAVFAEDGEQFAVGAGNAMIIPPPAYHRIRASSKTDCEQTARVVPQPHWPRVYVDREHPVYFDHDTDHVPGMLLVDAALRAVQHRLNDTAGVVGFEAAFDEFVEFEPTTFMKLSLNEQNSRGVSVDLIQAQRQRGHITVLTAPGANL
jgi:hypothetical protein